LREPRLSQEKSQEELRRKKSSFKELTRSLLKEGWANNNKRREE